MTNDFLKKSKIKGTSVLHLKPCEQVSGPHDD